LGTNCPPPFSKLWYIFLTQRPQSQLCKINADFTITNDNIFVVTKHNWCQLSQA
jgi:hypothetical protein